MHICWILLCIICRSFQDRRGCWRGRIISVTSSNCWSCKITYGKAIMSGANKISSMLDFDRAHLQSSYFSGCYPDFSANKRNGEENVYKIQKPGTKEGSHKRSGESFIPSIFPFQLWTSFQIWVVEKWIDSKSRNCSSTLHNISRTSEPLHPESCYNWYQL